LGLRACAERGGDKQDQHGCETSEIFHMLLLKAPRGFWEARP
jgi:hypothetical protein